MKRVLIVEDEPDIAELIRQLLEQAGFSASYAVDPRKGLKRLGECDLVILDLTMPHMSGMEFLEAARKKNADVPVILVSAHVLDREALEGIIAKYPGVSFVSKLDLHKDLVNAVNARLRK